MASIKELNERRALAEMRMRALGMLNTPRDAEDQLKAASQYRLAYLAWERAESDFHKAVNVLSTDELMALAAESGSTDAIG